MSNIDVNDNIVTFFSHESQVEETLSRVEDYIKQANIAYEALVAETKALQKGEKGKEQAKKAEIDAINKILKDF